MTVAFADPVSPVTTTPSQPAKILLIEDDRVSQRLCEKMLTNAGHTVLMTDTVSGAKELMRSQVLFDLVILDNNLSGQWGWEFLQEIRGHVVFREQPVVVYTGHTERSDMERYARLGVQGMHVKPMKADVLLGEVAKAKKSGWMDRLVEPVDVVCLRLKFSIKEYAGSLNNAVKEMEELCKIIRRKLASTADPVLWSSLGHIKQQFKQLGVPVIVNVATQVEQRLNAEECIAAANILALMDPLAEFVKQRALQLLEMNDSGLSGGADLGTTHQEPSISDPVDEESAGARRLINRPLWQFGDVFNSLAQRPWVDPASWSAKLNGLRSNPFFQSYFQSLELIMGADDPDHGNFARTLSRLHGASDYLNRLLPRLGVQPGKDGAAALAIARIGMIKTALISVVGVLPRTLSASPIHTYIKLQQTLAVMTASYELGRFFNVTRLHQVAAAGLASDLGWWVQAEAEPGVMAMALQFSGCGFYDAKIERNLFGATRAELGHRVLEQSLNSDLLINAVLHHRDPGQAPADDQLTVLLVHLAHLLVESLFYRDSAGGRESLSMLESSSHPVWKLFAHHKVSQPVTGVERVDLLHTLASSAIHSAREAIH